MVKTRQSAKVVLNSTNTDKEKQEEIKKFEFENMCWISILDFTRQAYDTPEKNNKKSIYHPFIQDINNFIQTFPVRKDFNKFQGDINTLILILGYHPNDTIITINLKVLYSLIKKTYNILPLKFSNIIEFRKYPYEFLRIISSHFPNIKIEGDINEIEPKEFFNVVKEKDEYFTLLNKTPKSVEKVDSDFECNESDESLVDVKNEILEDKTLENKEKSEDLLEDSEEDGDEDSDKEDLITEPEEPEEPEEFLKEETKILNKNLENLDKKPQINELLYCINNYFACKFLENEYSCPLLYKEFMDEFYNLHETLYHMDNKKVIKKAYKEIPECIINLIDTYINKSNNTISKRYIIDSMLNRPPLFRIFITLTYKYFPEFYE